MARNRGHITREVVDALDRLYRAREVAAALAAAKSGHPWTDTECSLLARLLVVLGEEGHGPKPMAIPNVRTGVEKKECR